MCFSHSLMHMDRLESCAKVRRKNGKAKKMKKINLKNICSNSQFFVPLYTENKLKRENYAP